MKVIMAKILDPTHLELSQPIVAPQGSLIKISSLMTAKRIVYGGRQLRSIFWKLMKLRMPFMTKYNFGDIVIIDFPQSGSNQRKR